jgi:amidase
MANGRLSAEELTLFYVDRIRRYDVNRLNAILELNPDALRIARERDGERAAGRLRGPMHGIPVLLKDNIATGDGMCTTAGAYALRNWQPARDAYLVRQLRSAGAVMLGKANLSEWANWMDSSMPNGFSTLGGQTRNPYGSFDPLGSSSGSAVAVAANLVTASVGTETRGSIISPGEANSIVALKTSLGLVSRDYIVPLVDWLDVPGPMGRTVTDVAVMLTAMTGADANDPATGKAAPLAGVDFTQYLDGESVQGMRVGVFGEKDAPFARQLAVLGMEVAELDPEVLPAEPDLLSVLAYGFKETLNGWLADLGELAPVPSLADVIAVNNQDMANRAPYGQGKLIDSQQTTITESEYADMTGQGRAVAHAMHGLFQETGVDLLLANHIPTVYATAGFPAITVPAGYDEQGKPMALKLMADFLGEPALIAAGYAYEQTTQVRRTPELDATIASFEELNNANPAIHTTD